MGLASSHNSDLMPSVSFSYYASNGATNASFAAALCEYLATFTDNPGSITISGGSSTPLELPECMWATIGLYSPSMTRLFLTNLIVRGNSSGTSAEVGPGSSNPLMRFSTSPTSVYFHDCTFKDPKAATYAPSWQAFLDRMTELTSLTALGNTVGGSVFTTLPAQLTTVTITDSGLTGSISSSLLSLVTGAQAGSSIYIDLTFNQLTGSLPAALFSNFAHSSQFSSSNFKFNGNKLSGNIPSALLSSNGIPSPSFSLYIGNNSFTGSIPPSLCESCPSFTLLDISQNQFAGTVPSGIFDAYLAKSPALFQFYAGNNSFTGSVPSIFANLPQPSAKRGRSSTLNSIRLDFSYNQFDSAGLNVVANSSVYVPGFQEINLSHNLLTSLPAGFLDSYASVMNIDLSGNKLTTLPAGFLQGMDYGGSHDASLSLGENKFTSLPDDLFNSSLTFGSFSFNISYNPTLTGSLPGSLTSLAASSIYYYTLDFSHCGFTGAIPNMPFVNEVDYLEVTFASNRLNNGSSGLSILSFINPNNDAGVYGMDLDFSDNAFEGVLDITGLTPSMRSNIIDSGCYFNASGNSFTALAFDDIWATAIYTLDISRNTLMTTAVFPESLYNESSVIQRLLAAKTGITGVFPAVTNDDFRSLQEIDFSGSSGIDFCSGSRTAWTTELSICKLYLTTAANCSNLYPSNCEFSAPPEAPPTAPTTAPSDSPSASPSATPGSPTAPTAPGTPSASPGTPSSTPTAPGTPSTAPHRPPTSAATSTSASLVAIGFAALLALVASL